MDEFIGEAILLRLQIEIQHGCICGNAEKLGMILYDSFSNSYFMLGGKIGKAWGEGNRYLK